MWFSLVVISLHVVEEPEGGEADGFSDLIRRKGVFIGSSLSGEKCPRFSLRPPRWVKQVIELLWNSWALLLEGIAAKYLTSFLDALDGA